MAWLIDTSAWVHALRKGGDASIRAEVENALRSGSAMLCDMVLLELWNGARGKDERLFLQRLERELHSVPTTEAVWHHAFELGRSSRQHGLTVPATDLLIAACASHCGLELIHDDTDFSRLSRALRLDL